MGLDQGFLPRSVLDTSLLPEHRRVSFWRETATSVWDVSPLADDPFYTRVDAFCAAELMFGAIVSCAQDTERAARRIAADGLDYFMLQFYVKGRRTASARKSEQVLSGGDLLVLDMTQPITTRSTAYQSIDLVAPRRLLEPLLTSPDVHGGRRLEGARPLVALLRSHVEALYRAGPTMTLAEAEAMQAPTLALAAAALNGGVEREHAAPVRAATWLAVRRYIEDNLADLRLSADAVALHFGVSRATLYRIMEAQNGFVAYVRRRRLHRCREAMANPANLHRGIADIAADWGFGNAAAFSVTFNRAFGLTPRDFRQRAQQDAGAASPGNGEADWSRWLAAMR